MHTPFLIGLVLKATVILLLATAVAGLLRRSSAAGRHLVWSLGLTALVALPALSLLLPGWRVPAVVPASFRTVDVQAAPASDAIAPATPASHAVTPPARATARAGVTDRATPPVADALSVDATPVRRTPSLEVTPPVRASRSLGGLLPTVWLFGIAVVLASIVAGVVRIRWLGRRAPVSANPRVRRVAAEMLQRLGVAGPVRIVEIADQAMPMTWGVWRPVILLPADAGRWPEERLRAVIAHEVAHVRRNDVLTQLVARIACALYWFHPLVWAAARRLREERELACDDLVLAAGSRASDYAQQLLDVARTLRPARFTAMASVAMARRSHLAGRLISVLDAGRSRAGVTRRLVLAAAAGAFLIVVPVASASMRAADTGGDGARPAADPPATAHAETGVAFVASVASRTGSQQGACNWASGEHTSSSTNIDDERTRIRIEVDGCRIEMDVDGEIAFNDDFTDVARIAGGGSFELEERAAGSRRRLTIDPGNGGLVRRWYVDGAERPYDAAAREWLARTLVVVFRRTGFQAEERGAWILRTRGLQGLLAEIDSIASDHAAGRYYEIALTQPNLDTETVRDIVTNAGRRVGSDYTLGRILRAVAPVYLEHEEVRAAFVQATGGMESDHEKRQVLSAVLAQEGLSTALASEILEQATTLDSDYELGELLRELIAAHPIEQSMTPTFFRAVESIGSDYERHRVLATLLAAGAPSQAVLDRALDAAEGMDSDHEVAELLLEVAERYPVDRNLPPSYVRAAQTLDSDYEQGRVWQTLIARQALTPATLNAVLDAAAAIGSDHEQGQLLSAVLVRHGVGPEYRDAFFRVVSRIGSDYTRGQILTQVIDRQPGDRAAVLAVVASARAISSDHELGTLLMHIADTVPLDDELRQVLREAADGIGSRSTRGQVLERIYPRGPSR